MTQNSTSMHGNKKVFCESGSKPNKILCAWHVDRTCWTEAGAKALKEHVQSEEERTHIYLPSPKNIINGD